MQRTLLALVTALVLGLSFSCSSAAEAQIADVHFGPSEDVWVPLALGGAVLGSVWVGFLVADTVSFAGHTPFDVELAVSDLVLGTLAIGAGVAALVFVAFYTDAPVMAAIGSGMVTLGAYQVSHGFWSLGTAHHGQAAPPTVALAPTNGGAMVSISGSF